MNHIYRTVFNRSLGVFQVASELASSAGGQSDFKGKKSQIHSMNFHLSVENLSPFSKAVLSTCNLNSPTRMGLGIAVLLATLGFLKPVNAEIVISNPTVATAADNYKTLGESLSIDNTTFTVPASAVIEMGSPVSYILKRDIALGSSSTGGSGTIIVNSVDRISVTQSVSGGDLIKEESGTLNFFTGNNTYANTFINQGTLSIGNSLGISGNLGVGVVHVSTGATIQVDGGNNNTLSNKITGGGNFVKEIYGGITLTGDNDYTGGTTVKGGYIVVGDGGATGTLGSGSVNITGGSVRFNRSDEVVVSNQITGAGSVRQIGTGTTTLMGNNNYAGGTTISGGTLHISSATNIGTGGLTFSNGAVLQTDATVGSLGTRDIVMSAGGGTFSTASGSTLVVGGAVSGAGGLKAAGSGTLTLTGTNTYLGGTTVDGGKLSISNDSNLGAAGTGVTISNGASLEATATTNLGSRGVTLGAGGGTLGATGSSTDLTVGGVVSGTDLTTSGPGRVILTGNNTYDQTNISSGSTLQVGNGGTTGTLGTGAVTNDGTLTINRSDAITVGNDINGTGALNKTGTGTTTLTGTNGYTGTTTISAGTLQVGNGGTTGTLGSGNVVTNLGTGLVFDRSNEMTVNNVISGGGSVTQSGTGNTTLAGSNTYTGGTTIDGGTLSVSSNGNLGAVGTGVNISNGAALAATATTDLGSRGVTLGTGGGTLEAVGAGTNLTVGGVVSGTELTKAGEGTVILAGANTYTGGTTIDGGTLSISSDSNLGVAGSGVNINNGATLSSTASTDLGARDVALGTGGGTLEAAGGSILTVGGTVSGTDLTTAGAGTVVLTANNTYDQTNITSGSTLQVGNGGTTGTLGTGAVTNDGTLTINRSDSITVGNDISGTGGLTQAGTGTTTLTGNNTYAGTTTIDDGVLKVGNGGSTGTLGSGPILNNSALEFDRTGALNIPGDISGSGTVTQSGPGTTTLSGSNTYSGDTFVNAGVLQAGGANSLSPNSVHTVGSGGTLDLAGHAQTLPGLNNSGTVNLAGPGEAANNVLTLTGPYVGNGGSISLSAKPDSSDKMVMSGPNAVASGNTTIHLASKDGLGAATTGNGLSVVTTENGGSLQPGAFTMAGGHADAGAYEYHLEQGPNGMYLQSSKVLPQGAARVTTYRAEAPLLAALPGQLRQADMDMLGSLHTRQGLDSAQNASLTGDAKTDAGMDRRVWGRVLRTDPTIRQNNGEARPNTTGHMTGFQAGLDLYADGRIRAGLYVGQLEGDLSVRGNSAGVDRNYVGFNNLRTRYLGVYGTWQGSSGLYADAVLQGADYRSNLHTAGDSVAARTATTKGSGWLASLEVGKPFAVGSNWQIEPQAQLIYRKMSVDDTFLDAAQVKTSTEGDWTLRLGARVKGSFATSAGVLQPYARVNVYHSSSTNDVARFITPVANTALQTRGGSTSTELAAGAALQVTPATSMYAELGKLWANGGNSRVGSGVQASVGVRVRW